MIAPRFGRQADELNADWIARYSSQLRSVGSGEASS